MTQWFKSYRAALHDPTIQRLRPADFKRKMLACMDGEINEFSPFLKRGSDRPAAHIWVALRADVFARDDYTCRYCGERGRRLECDHYIPVALGGESVMENLRTACRPCNRAKRDKSPEQWEAARGA